MQEINWDHFNSKFSGRQRDVFQWLCYLLFCIEYDRPLGVSRYENHAGIETNPIRVGNDLVGWQAKFLEASTSSYKKKTFTESIDTTLKKHPKVTKILFYINRDFGQDPKGTDPKMKTQVEDYAKKAGISVEWKQASFFESPFVTKDNAVIVKYFFSLDDSLHDLINKLKEQTEAILNPIRSDIPYKNKQIKIDRQPQIDAILRNLSVMPTLVISGNGGSGKTAIIKDFYGANSDVFTVYCFKATDFANRRNISEVFKQYGKFEASDFASAFPDSKTKIVVIDSAERLSEIADRSVFNQFVDLLYKNGWKIVFTTRRGFVSDLTTSLVDIYGIGYSSYDVPELSSQELENLSKTHGFKLPKDERLNNLLHNPFYLHEYLRFYDDGKGDLDYESFKDNLWNKQIAKSNFTKDDIHIHRGEGFISLAVKRANQGGFSVDIGNEVDTKALSALRKDEVIAFDDKTGGYFITHDVYEEWALGKFIERAFKNTSNTEDFITTIGDSRPIRRAFRVWLTDKLLSEKEAAASLIKDTLSSDKIADHWKDEVLVASLLSDYASELLSAIESDLLKKDGVLLKKVIFLLRIACKDIDETFLQRLGASRFKPGSLLGHLYTVPTGSGWEYIIQLIYKHKDTLELSNWTHILDLLKDWNSKNKTGETTKYASEIGLFYYETIADNDALYSLKDREKKLVEVILSGSVEIKDKIAKIVDTVTSDPNFNHRSRYEPIAKYVLGSIVASMDVATATPEEVMRLGEYVWLLPKPEDPHGFGRSRMDIDDDFGLSRSIHEYYPASSLQTPIATLLNIKPKETLDFIIRLTNKSIDIFSESELSQNETEEIKLTFADGSEQTQLIGPRIWEIYRGTHHAPDLLESIHMGLEKWLLDYVANAPEKEAVDTCLKLLKDSTSASITAVVTSVVYSRPFKLREVALVLFRTKRLFDYEKTRLLKDRTHKSTLESLSGIAPSRDYMQKLHQDERIKACDLKHRQWDLENLAVNYQFFRNEEDPKEESEKLVKSIWEIIDQYYSELPPEKKQKEHDKTWRLCLARMDKRKMEPTIEQKDGQTLINFNPQIDPKLKKYSEDFLSENNKSMEHTTLSLWARYRWEKKSEYDDQYKIYDKNYKKAITETKTVIKKIQKKDKHVGYFEQSIPVYVAGVLLRDYANKLTKEERDWCASIILEIASIPSTQGYSPQVGDGVSIAISSLPNLIGINNETDEAISLLLLCTLFNLHHIGSNQTLSDIAVVTILHNLWKVSTDIAESILAGYILLKPAYDKTREKVRQANIKAKKYETSEHEVIEQLDNDYDKQIEDVLSGKITLKEVSKDISDLDTAALAVTFELIPYRTDEEEYKQLAITLLESLSKNLADREDRDRYFHTYSLFEKITHFILTSDKSDIRRYLEPFINNFEIYRSGSDLLEAFLSAADKLPDSYENFWEVWDIYYPKILEISKSNSRSSWDTTVIHNYLFAWMYFKEDAREWHILKKENKKFFEKVVKEFGSPVAVLYSLAKILYDVGSDYLENGINWLGALIGNNPDLEENDWEVNTLYHLEYVLRKYVINHREEIRKNRRLKEKVLTILNMMVNKGSVSAYLLREDIL